jgi:predicted nucleic acid-binding Zn ribbon protein
MNLSPGSTESIEFLTTLTNISSGSSIFASEMIQNVLQFKWKRVKHIMASTFIIWILFLIALVIDEHKYLIFFAIVKFVLLLSKFLRCIVSGSFELYYDILNVLEVITCSLLVAYLINESPVI